MKIVIKSASIGNLEAQIEFDENPKTAEAVLSALPLEGEAMLWGRKSTLRFL